MREFVPRVANVGGRPTRVDPKLFGNDALGFESWRKLCKEYGTGLRLGRRCTSTRIFSEYDFGTTDGFKKRLLKWDNGVSVTDKSVR